MSRGFVITLIALAWFASSGYLITLGVDHGIKIAAGEAYMAGLEDGREEGIMLTEAKMFMVCAITHKIKFDNLLFRCGPVVKA